MNNLRYLNKELYELLAKIIKKKGMLKLLRKMKTKFLILDMENKKKKAINDRCFLLLQLIINFHYQQRSFDRTQHFHLEFPSLVGGQRLHKFLLQREAVVSGILLQLIRQARDLLHPT